MTNRSRNDASGSLVSSARAARSASRSNAARLRRTLSLDAACVPTVRRRLRSDEPVTPHTVATHRVVRHPGDRRLRLLRYRERVPANVPAVGWAESRQARSAGVGAPHDLPRHGGVELTITETVLVFVGIPAAVIAIIYGLVFATSSASNSKRYRPGRPFNQSTVWFIANTPGGAIAGHGAREIGAGSGSHALSGGTADSGATQGAHRHEATEPGHDGSGLTTVGYGETGGASDSW